MKNNGYSRRQFLLSSACGLSTVSVALHWPAILSVHVHAQKVAASGKATEFQFFSPAQAFEVEAMAGQIIPTDTSPGAREAHVVYFIDRALTTFDRDKQPLYSKGLAELQARMRSLFPGADKFSGLSSEQQIRLLTAIEKTEFFELVRIHTIMGFLSNPEYGGNYNQVGWKLIGFEDTFYYEAPFGYYDAEIHENQPAGRADKS